MDFVKFKMFLQFILEQLFDPKPWIDLPRNVYEMTIGKLVESAKDLKQELKEKELKEKTDASKQKIHKIREKYNIKN